MDVRVMPLGFGHVRHLVHELHRLHEVLERERAGNTLAVGRNGPLRHRGEVLLPSPLKAAACRRDRGRISVWPASWRSFEVPYVAYEGFRQLPLLADAE